MISIKRAVLFGFLIWLIAFVISFLIFPIHENNRPLFESIMPIVISIFTSFFSYKYLKTVKENFVKESVLLATVFILVNWTIDMPLMLSPSPMQMTFSDYFQDIGITYFMMLPITIAMGYLANQLKKV
jgi:hypothetical protein